jgi:uncharacterized RDD family membrane protein YckC
MRLDHIAFAPVRAAARSSAGILTDEAERAIDAVLAGPLPEAFGRSLVEHRVAERVVMEMLETASREGFDADEVGRLVDRVLQSPALEQWLTGGEGVRLAETYVERLVRSDAFRNALKEILSSAEIRAALAGQTAGFADDIADAGRRRAGGLDDAIAERVARLLRRPRTLARPPFAGVASRGIALVVDAGLAALAFLVAAGSIALVTALAGGLREGWLAGSLAGVGWFLVAAAFFVSFWTVTGQTPGMRLTRVRVVTASGTPPSPLRSLVRFVGLILAVIPLFAGFLPALVDRRRRALQDFLAGTVVVYDAATEASGTSGSLNSTSSE